ncbi:unnamed protein product [Adineta steineri]|uniref:Tetratricopeptide repeat protein n=2 Tax=Adineta steineri TaxID=433720 RepID=A0A818PG93_9BILA|nr:unnamed protein product [Adineta steineri]CAF3618570.1 unnamed protein product [Adineta steineri]
MGCNTSTTAVAPTMTVQPTKTAQSTVTHEFNKKDDVQLMYSQLFKEFLSQMSENDRSTVISFCPDLYTNDNLSDLISTNPELLNRTNIMRKKLIDENPTVSMGRLMLEMGSYDRAEYLYFKAIHQEKNNWKRLTVVYNNLANVYYKEGKYDKALTYYHKSLSIQQKHLPENDSSLSIDYNNIAIVYETQKNYDLALQFFQSALILEMKASKPDEKLIAFLNNHIGLIHNEQQNFAQGLIYHERNLRINEKLFPATHPSLALSHHNIAISLFSLGRSDEALNHTQKAIQIASQTLPDDQPQIIAHRELLNAIQKKKAMKDYVSLLQIIENEDQ